MKISHYTKSHKIIYNKNSKLTCLKHISGPFRNSDFHREYLWNFCDKMSNILTIDTLISFLHLLKIARYETSQNRIYSENGKPSWIQAFSRELTCTACLVLNIWYLILKLTHKILQKLKNFPHVLWHVFSTSSNFLYLNHSRKKKISKMLRWPLNNIP